ncbi:MAG: adenosylcobinamide-GDP ribazoletransferase [Gemmatimonadales bacterium]|nr:adenosylcobinamide-GDP ribazoletransferase [Gemmatimonadales bacterium]MYG48976.1 adenosylcobinamide-GDP ribazoletransferase [Gemmatimonadales bacterium]MYK01384.1 adenosylcobinamide-GDP ribazoletransferase [Candidatus Palauibacter ramosifaciens]
MRASLRGARAAFVFLTRLPLGGFPYSAEEWRWASAWFPFVGMVLGGVCAAVWGWLAPLGPWVAAMSVLVLSILLTGAFHEDGLADTADALGGATDREGIFVILKDSRIGAFGGLALVTSIAFRLVLLAQLGSPARASALAAAPAALLLAHGLARVGPVWLMVALPYASAAAAKSGHVARAGAAQAAVATVVGVAGAAAVAVAAGAIDATGALAAFAAMALATVLCGLRFRARAGGVTGDFLGATEQVNEIAILGALLAVQVAQGAA